MGSGPAFGVIIAFLMELECLMPSNLAARIIVVAWLGAAACGLAGCDAELAADLLAADLLTAGQPQPQDESGGESAGEDTVTVRFRNVTLAEAVDVQFHVGRQPFEVLPDDLFVPENLIKASIGVAGTGIVQPGREDAVQHPCERGLVIGTVGGYFMDNESGEPRGTGVPRWVEEGPLALCGGVVTFVFSGDGNAFTTTVTVNH
jgi:hypothetical protein